MSRPAPAWYRLPATTPVRKFAPVNSQPSMLPRKQVLASWKGWRN